MHAEGCRHIKEQRARSPLNDKKEAGRASRRCAMGERIVVSDFMGEKYEGDQDNRKRDLPCTCMIVHLYQLNMN